VKNNLVFRILTLVLFFGLITLEIFGQQSNGKIVGKVTDKKTGETLIGLNVKVTELSKGASTDVEGRYILAGIPAGKYTLQFTYVGYATKTISDVIVSAGTVTTLDAAMDEPAGNQLQTVVISVSAKKESTAGLYAQQKNAVSISSGIASDQIKKSPDKNTSDVLKRVSGASIQDNKFIVVRGLSDRYNSAMLNNSMLPNTEVDKKAFSFDIIPSNLIDAIVVNKSASADMPGDFSGGVVQVTTKDFPDSKVLNVSIGTSYNTQSAFQTFVSAKRSGKEVFGFYDKSRGIPSSFPSAREFRTLRTNASTDIYSLSRQFSNNWGYSTSTSQLSPVFQVNYGTSKVFNNNNKLGTILSLSYRYDQRLKESVQNAYSGQALGDRFNDDVYSYNTAIGGVANFAYSWGTNKISLKNLYNRVLENQFTSRIGVDDSNNPFKRTGDYLLQRSLISNQLTGDHLLSETSRIKLDWNLNYANTDRKEPGYKRMDYSDGGTASIQSGSAVAALAGNFSSELKENSYGAATNLTVPIKWLNDKNKIKFGYFSQFRKRDFNARVIGFIRDPYNTFDQSLLSLPQDKIFAPENIRPGGFVLDEITNGEDHYDAQSTLNAGYAMFDGFLSEKLRLSLGARLESYNLKLSSADNSNLPFNIDSTATSILPSANLIYSLNDKSNIRVSASQTIGRPEFREVAPFSFYDFNKNVNVRGNQHLKQSKTTNADLGYAIYPSAGEVISISGFFKYFENPIEIYLDQAASGRSLSYTNRESATLYGVELEFRKSLKFLGSKFKNFNFNTNASLMKSEVVVSRDVNRNGVRPLQGQSPYLINAGLQYNSSKPNTTGISLLYNRIGRRIWAVGNSLDGDVYENPRNVLDFQVSQRFAKSRAELKLNYSDILNNRAIYYQFQKNAKANNDYVEGTHNLNMADRFGSTVSLSLSYKIQ